MPEETITPKTEAAAPAVPETAKAAAPTEAAPAPVEAAPAPVVTPAPAPVAAPAAPAAAPAVAPAPVAAPAPVIAPVVVQPPAPAPVAPSVPWAIGPDQPSAASQVSVEDTVSIAKVVAKEAAKEAVKEAWFDGMGLNEDQAGFMANKKFNSLGDMVTSSINLEKFAGGSKKVVEVPGEGASEEVVKTFRDKIGAPSSVDELDIPTSDDSVPEIIDAFKKAVVEQGIPAPAAAAVANEVINAENGLKQVIAEKKAMEADAEIKVLEQELGPEGMKAAVEKVNRVANGDGAMKEMLSAVEDKVGPATAVKLGVKIADATMEDTFEAGKETDGFGASPAQAKAKEEELLRDPNFKASYMKGDTGAVAQITKLKAQQLGVAA